MNSIGAPSVSTVPGDSPALTQATADSDAPGGFGLFLQPQMEKTGASLPQQQAAPEGESPKMDVSKEPKDDASQVPDNSMGMNFLAACLVTIPVPPTVPVITTPVAASSECAAKPTTGEADTKTASASNGNSAVVSSPSMWDAVYTAKPVVATEPVANIAGSADIGKAKGAEVNTPAAAEQQTVTVSNNTQTAFRNPKNVFSSINTPALSALTTQQAVGGETSQPPTATPTDDLVFSGAASVLQNGLSSEKIAGAKTVVSNFSVKDQNGDAEKIAGSIAVPEASSGVSESNPVQSIIQGIIVPTDGMPVATQRETMPAARPQTEKKMPLSEKAAPVVPQSHSADTAAATAPLGANSREKSFDSGEEAPSNGLTLFSPTPSSSLATRDMDAAPKFQSEPTAKSGSTQEISSIFNHTLEAAERMRSDGQSRVEVQVRLHDGQELTIQLSMNAGEVHSVIKTNSADLRVALEQNWSQFSADSADRGLRVAAPVFSSGQSGLGDFQQGREQYSQQQQPAVMMDEELQQPSPAKPIGTASFSSDAVSSSEPTVLSLFA